MAENIDEIAVLIEGLKRNNEVNDEDYRRILAEIKEKVDGIKDNAEALAGVRRLIDMKLSEDSDKISEIDATLEGLRNAINSSTDYSELTGQVKTLSDNFKSGFTSVVNFANRDADAKNLILDRLDALESAVKNGAMIETLRHRTDDLVKGYENFISDSNLRHGNMVSALVDLKNKIDDYSSKNNYVYGTIERSIDDTNSKIEGLESTVSSNLGNVNSKLYSMGDDIQKILNDGFDHLKYLSSNMSEAMNSNSIDFKTTIEVLKANIMDYSDHLKDEFAALNKDITTKIETGDEAGTMLGNDILDNVKRVENIVISKSEDYANLASNNFNNILDNFKQIENIITSKAHDYENLVAAKVNEIVDFINALKDAVAVLKVDNQTYLTDRLSELGTQLQDVNSGFEKMMANSSEEIKELSSSLVQASEEVVRRLQETDIEEIVNLKDELLSSSSSNFNALVEKVEGVNDSVEAFKNSAADNLNGYLDTLRELFIDFSSKVENSQNNTEILDKLSKLEDIMNRFDAEKNENFERLQTLIENNAAAIDSIKDNVGGNVDFSHIEAVIEEKSNSKDEKLEEIKNLLNNQLSSREEKLQELKDLINGHSSSKDEKLTGIENLLNDIDMSKDNQFQSLRDLISENSISKDEKLEEIKNLLNNQLSSREEKLQELKDLINGHSSSKDEKLAKIESIVSNLNVSADSERLASIENLLSNLNVENDDDKFDELKNIIYTNSNSKDEKLNGIYDLIRNNSSIKDEKLEDIKNIVNELSLTENGRYNEIKEIVGNSIGGDENKFNELRELIDNNSRSKDEKLETLKNLVNEYRESLEKISENMQQKSDTALSELSEIKLIANDTALASNSKHAIENLENIINNNLLNYKSDIIAEISAIRDSISAISDNLGHVASGYDDSALSSKLSLIDEEIAEYSQNYEQSIAILSSRLNNYVEAVQNVSKETDDSLENSENEFNSIRTRFDELSEKLTNLVGNSGLIEILANIRQQFDILSSEIKKERTGAVEDVKATLDEILAIINNNLYLIGQNVEKVYTNQTENSGNIIASLDSGISSIRADLNNLAENVSNTIEEKLKSVADNFGPLENAIDGYANFDYANMLAAVKEQIELSYVTFSNEVKDLLKDEFSTGKVEESYKDAVARLSALEEVVNDSINANLETINNVLANVHNLTQSNFSIAEEIQSEFQSDLINLETRLKDAGKSNYESITEKLQEIKNLIEQNKSSGTEIFKDTVLPAVDNEELLDVIRGLNKSLADKIIEMKQDTDLAAQDIADVIGSVRNTVDYTLDLINEKFENSNKNASKIIDKLDELDRKVGLVVLASGGSDDKDSGVFEDIKNIKDDINSILSNKEIYSVIDSKVNELNSKLDIIVQSGNEEIFDSVDSIIDDIRDLKDNFVKSIDAKLDILAQDSSEEILSDVAADIEKLSEDVQSVKTSIESSSGNTIDKELFKKKFDELKSQLAATETSLEEYSKSNTTAGLSVENLIKELNSKVDIIAMSDDNGVLDEIYEIKGMVEAQIDALKEASSDNTNNVYTKLNDELVKIDTSLKNIDLSKSAAEIKDSVISAVVSLTNGISFAEESEEIKDFVNDRTNELHRMLLDVKHQLSAISNAGDDMDLYTYTMQDVESDLAKLRLVVNDVSSKVSDNELAVVSANLTRISKSMEDLKDVIIESEVKRVSYEELSEEILSISSRLNKLMIIQQNSDEKLINQVEEGVVNAFGSDSKLIMRRIEKHLSEIDKKLEYTVQVNTILKNVMMYLGEWMDGTTDTLASIYDKSVSGAIADDLKDILPAKSDLYKFIESKYYQQEANIENMQNILDNVVSQSEFRAEELQSIIEGKLMSQDSKISKLQSFVEEKISRQESRLDRIEMQLDRICSALEARDNNTYTAEKIDELDNKLSGLSKNIEKLASYVD